MSTGLFRKALALCRAWLVVDFFGDSRRSGQPGSSLTSAIFTQAFIALVFAALSFDASISLVAYAAANLSLSTLLLGVGLGADPGDAERLLADRVLVGTAPVPRALLPLARAAHASFALVLVTVGMALPPAILAGFAARNPLVVPAYLLAAVVLAGIAAGSFALLVRIVLRFGGAVRAALVAGTTKALVLGGGLVAFALALPHLDETAAALPGGRLVASCWPPYWAARCIAAPLDDIGYGLALGALGAGLLGLGLRIGEVDDARTATRIGTGRRSALQRLERWLCGQDLALRGVTRWTAAMLFRSPGFRSRVLPLFGIPVAFVFLAFGEQGLRERTALLGVSLQLPAIYLPFLVAFVPHADHAGTAWLFETGPRPTRVLGREAARIAIAVRILLPIQLVAAAAIAALGLGGWLALGLPAFSFGLSVAVLAWATRGLEHVPFTAEADEPASLEFGGLVGVALVLAALGIGAGLLGHSPLGGCAGLAIASTALVFLRRAERRTVPLEAPA
jgi:hypothetical protein